MVSTRRSYPKSVKSLVKEGWLVDTASVSRAELSSGGNVGTTAFPRQTSEKFVSAGAVGCQVGSSTPGSRNGEGCYPIHRRNVMRRFLGRTGWASIAAFFSAAVMTAGLSFTATPAQAAFELPEGEKITNLPAIPRNIPQKEAYELYDPKIGKNFDLKNFWMRADLRVRPEWRNGVCFGGSTQTGFGACNSAVRAT